METYGVAAKTEGIKVRSPHSEKWGSELNWLPGNFINDIPM